MESFKFYEVGGKIRDEILGLASKDVDYVAVPTDELLKHGFGAEQMFTVLLDYLHSEKFEVFLVTEDCYTIRAKFPKDYKYQGVADFVMARKEVGYVEGTRTPIVKSGNLYDDLSRRDFTVNALAKDPDTGEIIDYFGGIEDLKNKILRTPLDPIITFDDDPLRILRGVRFSVTKGFGFAKELLKIIKCYDYNSKMSVVSEERIREELFKCFKHDTKKTLLLFDFFDELERYVFTKTDLWLKPTNEK